MLMLLYVFAAASELNVPLGVPPSLRVTPPSVYRTGTALAIGQEDKRFSSSGECHQIPCAFAEQMAGGQGQWAFSGGFSKQSMPFPSPAGAGIEQVQR